MFRNLQALLLRFRQFCVILGPSLVCWLGLAGPSPVLALNPALDISQYAHSSSTVRDGFALGNIYAMAQTPDGYLWFGSEFGLFRYDGVRAVRWQPPVAHGVRILPYSMLVTRNGTLWIGMFTGLLSWDGARLTSYAELENRFVTSLYEDRDGTVWAGVLQDARSDRPAVLCALRNGHAQCSAQGGAFGGFVWGLYQDRTGNLWAGAESGLWQWKPGAPRHYPMPQMRISDFSATDDGRPLIAVNGKALMQFGDGKVKPYPIRSATKPDAPAPDHEIDSNKLLRDRDGGLWIGTVTHGLIHVHQGRTDVFTKADGLSGNIILSLFEDREGTVWVATVGGIDRFREFAVTAISTKQGLSADESAAVTAGEGGSVWIATYDALNKWTSGHVSIYRKKEALADDLLHSLYRDDRGRIWVSSPHGLAYLEGSRFVAAGAIPSSEVYSMTGDKAGNLWVSGNRGFSHLLDGHLVEHFPWPALGRHQQAKSIVFDPGHGGIWLSFWNDGGVLYFKDGQVRASYTAKDGLGSGHVPHLRLDRDGALWAATEDGGLSRIQNGRITTLTTRNGLPCDTIHWSMEDDDRSTWLYTSCGLVRIARGDLDAWIADPNHRIGTTVWDAADGVRLGSVAPSSYGPLVAKSESGELWFVTGDGVGVVNPHRLAQNRLLPPVHIEKIVADHKTYWENLPGTAASNLRLPAGTRDLQIDFTALSPGAPEKVRFRYKLEGQDPEWREVINHREAQYSNLGPGAYHFRLMACNNSGVWSPAGDSLEFSIAPAYYQTNWFRALCALLVAAIVWAIYEARVRQLCREFALTLDARVGERVSIARELHDTLLQSFQGLLLRFQIVSQLLPERPQEAKEQLDRTIDRAAKAIAEGRDAVQGLRGSTAQTNNLAEDINALGEELATDPVNDTPPAFRITIEGEPIELHPILRDDVYRIAAEALRNAFHHASAQHVEVEIRYDHHEFRLRVRDDGKGIDAGVLLGNGSEKHYGLPGMRERAKLIGGELTVWTEVREGTEVELSIPGEAAYTTQQKHPWLPRAFTSKGRREPGES